MTLLRALTLGTLLCFCALARAVYAPIPTQEQGKDLTISLEAGISYNTNIFGAATGAIASTDFDVSPKISYNASVTDQTFFSAYYKPTVDYFDNRPGTKTVFSQSLDARVAHAFSSSSSVDLSDVYSYNQNPEALLNGTAVNTDQTLQSNEFDGRCTFSPVEKLGLVVKARSVYYDYTNPILGDQLNRFENLYGIESDYSLLPTVKLAGEYRHQDVDYENNPSDNNKHSDFLMAGFDYSAGPKLSLSLRLGGEYRQREDLPSETVPYAELSGKYDYAKGSFISVGYTYSLEETSDPIHFSDEKTNRMFVNIQHAVSSLIVASASFDYEPSVLIGRPGELGDINETGTHAGVALSYIPTKNWTVSASYDYDNIDSGLASRNLNRSRVGLSATVVF